MNRQANTNSIEARMFFKHCKSLWFHAGAERRGAALCGARICPIDYGWWADHFENRLGGMMALFGENFTFHATLPTSKGRLRYRMLNVPPGNRDARRIGMARAGFWGRSSHIQRSNFQCERRSQRDGYGGIDILGFITVPELVGTLATVTVPFSLEGFVYTPESFQGGRAAPG